MLGLAGTECGGMCEARGELEGLYGYAGMFLCCVSGWNWDCLGGGDWVGRREEEGQRGVGWGDGGLGVMGGG